MLNSRYAPVVALTVLAIILVGVLGWFLAIKPQLDQRGEISSTASEVVTNTEQIQLESSQIDQFAARLAELPDYSEAIATHAPDTFHVEDARTRIADAISASQAEIVSFEHGGVIEVEGWALPAKSLPSSRLAALYKTGPLHAAVETEAPEAEAEVFVPVVTPATGDETTRTFYGIPVTVEIAAPGQNLLDVLAVLENPDLQLFQIYDVQFESRPERAGSINGVSDPEDGDAILTFTGFFYLQDPTTEIVDEGDITGEGLGSIDPFTPIEGGVEQPGAS